MNSIQVFLDMIRYVLGIIRITGLLIFALTYAVNAQNNVRVVAGTDGPIGFVRIQYWPSGRMDITNASGEFQLNAAPGDVTIEFKVLAYKLMKVPLSQLPERIILQAASYTLPAFTIKATDDRWVKAMRLCAKFLKRQPEVRLPSYWVLFSSANNQQAEFMEGFYNSTQEYGQLTSLSLKQGRAGLKDRKGQFYCSLNTSKVFTSVSLTSNTPYFPEVPMSLSFNELRKNYHFVFLGNIGDSVAKIEFSPIKKKGEYFSGTLTLNVITGRPLLLVCKHEATHNHPFQSVFETTDDLSPMALNLTWQFSEEDKPFRLIRQSIAYSFQYNSDRHPPLSVETEGVWYALEQQKEFLLPVFDFTPEVYDYRSFSFLPPNPGFWSRQQPPVLTQLQKSYRDDFIRENRMLYQHRSEHALPRDLFESRLLIWNDSLRLNMKRFPRDNQAKQPEPSMNMIAGIPEVRLEAGIYLDVNEWDDSLEVTSYAFLNPFRCSIPVKAKQASSLLLNLYLDLYELERRAFMKAVKFEKNPEKVFKLHHQAEQNARERANQMLFELGLSGKKLAAERWTAYVLQAGGPDNTPFLQEIP